MTARGKGLPAAVNMEKPSKERPYAKLSKKATSALINA
jgi:hypothetical protein